MVNHHNIKMMINNLIVCLPPQRIQVPRPPRVEPVRLLGHQGWSVAEVPVGSTVPGNIFNFQLLQIMHGVRRRFKGWVAVELGWTILLMQAHHLLKGGLQLSGTPAYRPNNQHSVVTHFLWKTIPQFPQILCKCWHCKKLQKLWMIVSSLQFWTWCRSNSPRCGQWMA